jgi:hypothetical protein
MDLCDPSMRGGRAANNSLALEHALKKVARIFFAFDMIQLFEFERFLRLRNSM